jgi:hypothetical protein
MPRKIGNLPTAPLRWPVDRAVEEFGQCTAHTLRKLLRRNGSLADANGTFSTQAIAAAIYGDLAAEKLRTQRELTKKLQLENSIATGAYLNRAELSKGLAGIADAMCSIISTSSLSRTEQEDLRRQLADAELICETVARNQSKLPRRSRNVEADGDENES